jgi:predicted house-cleaning NTP pyrophosphatase (Maf/HAM1 superfamily)
VDRVKWFRERANRDRYREEVEILEADFERTIFSHSRMAEVWTGMAEHFLNELGAAAYARKKAVMYRNLSDEASQKYTDAKADADKAGRYTSQHI